MFIKIKTRQGRFQIINTDNISYIYRSDSEKGTFNQFPNSLHLRMTSSNDSIDVDEEFEQVVFESIGETV